VECHIRGLDFPFLHGKTHPSLQLHRERVTRGDTNLDVNFVTAENDWDVLANPLQITMPVGHVLIRDSGCNVEHDDATLSLNVVSVSKTTKLFLSRGVPNVKDDSAVVGREWKGSNFDSERG
jgi:hypothetical protein